MSFIPYAKQSINSTDIDAVAAALRGEIITRGPLVEAFEAAIADYCGVKYAVAYNSGSSALMGAFRAANANPFDRIISSPNTFVATVGAAVQCGVKPFLVDIDVATGNMDLNKLEDVLYQQRTRGRTIIAPVHFSGIPVDIEALSNMLREQESIIIEDACHALGSRYIDGSRVGSCPHSEMTVFSFHPAKSITTGEGGAVTTNDPKLYHQLKLHRNNGIERDPEHLESTPYVGYGEIQALGGNFNFTEAQAALGISQLKRLDTFIAKRRTLVAAYRKRLSGIRGVEFFDSKWDENSAHNLFAIKVDFQALKRTRQDVMNSLLNKGIQTQVHYVPVYRQPAMKKSFTDAESLFPCMEEYYAKVLTLPLYPDLTLDEIAQVAVALRSVL